MASTYSARVSRISRSLRKACPLTSRKVKRARTKDPLLYLKCMVEAVLLWVPVELQARKEEPLLPRLLQQKASQLMLALS